MGNFGDNLKLARGSRTDGAGSPEDGAAPEDDGGGSPEDRGGGSGRRRPGSGHGAGWTGPEARRQRRGVIRRRRRDPAAEARVSSQGGAAARVSARAGRRPLKAAPARCLGRTRPVKSVGVFLIFRAEKQKKEILNGLKNSEINFPRPLEIGRTR